MNHSYERLKEDGKIETAPINDPDGKITGKFVIGVKQWFDENPEEAKKRGWIKHIHLDAKDIRERYPCNKGSQYLMASTRQVDPWTVEDVYYVMDKTEEQMLFEDMLAVADSFSDGFNFIGGEWA